MEPQRFDHLVTKFATGQIGRRRFVASVVALGLGLSHMPAGTRALAGSSSASLPGHAATSAQVTPFNPFDWFCWPGGPGPTVPWFPVVPDPDSAIGTRVRLYGLHFGEDDVLTMAAFGNDGQEVSRCETWRDPDGALRLRFSDAATQLDGLMRVERDDAGEARVTGEFGGQPVDTSTGEDPTEPQDPAQRTLLADWTPMTHEMNGLFDAFATVEDDTATAGGLKCAGAGFLAGLGCLGSVGGAGIFGVSSCVDNASNLYNAYCTY